VKRSSAKISYGGHHGRMHNDVLKLCWNYEITEKPDTGWIRRSGVGTSYIPSDSDDLGITSLRAILDIVIGYAANT
jgi:hypothetical protein